LSTSVPQHLVEFHSEMRFRVSSSLIFCNPNIPQIIAPRRHGLTLCSMANREWGLFFL